MKLARFLAVPLLAFPLFVLPALAQDYDRPPAGVGEDRGGGGYGGPDQGPGGDQQDPGGMAVRVGKLEGRIRDMTGQIEELQNANRKLVEQLQKFQADVDSRLSSGGGRAKRSDASPPPEVASPAPVEAKGTPPKPERKARRDDAYDPDAAPAADPGKPKALGSTASAQPDDGDGAPMDLSGGKLRRSDTGAGSETLAPTLRLPPAAAKPGGASTRPNDTVVASTGPASPRAEFDAALGFYKGKQYEDAERGFSTFIQKNPKSRLAADATYYLGESFAQRGRSREAAEQYLKVSTDYASSTRAPDAMLHLGMSLKALGAKEQACATFTEVNRKYPNAPSYVKSGVERESKRAQC